MAEFHGEVRFYVSAAVVINAESVEEAFEKARDLYADVDSHDVLITGVDSTVTGADLTYGED